MRRQQCAGHNVKLFFGDLWLVSTATIKFYIIIIIIIIIIWCSSSSSSSSSSGSSSTSSISTVSVDIEALLRRRLFEIYFTWNSL
jgi:hypothetical protein